MRFSVSTVIGIVLGVSAFMLLMLDLWVGLIHWLE